MLDTWLPLEELDKEPKLFRNRKESCIRIDEMLYCLACLAHLRLCMSACLLVNHCATWDIICAPNVGS